MVQNEIRNDIATFCWRDRLGHTIQFWRFVWEILLTCLAHPRWHIHKPLHKMRFIGRWQLATTGSRFCRTLTAWCYQRRCWSIWWVPLLAGESWRVGQQPKSQLQSKFLFPCAIVIAQGKRNVRCCWCQFVTQKEDFYGLTLLLSNNARVIGMDMFRIRIWRVWKRIMETFFVLVDSAFICTRSVITPDTTMTWTLNKNRCEWMLNVHWKQR